MSLEDADCSTWLTLAGSTSAGGCLHIYRDMLKYGMIDVVVSTGTPIVDMDFFEALGFTALSGPIHPSTTATCATSTSTGSTTPTSTRKNSRTAMATIHALCEALEARPYSSREFIWEMGKWLAEEQRQEAGLAGADGLRRRRADLLPGLRRPHRPALARGAPGRANESWQALPHHRRGRRFPASSPTSRSPPAATGLFMVGGGVPKNFAQDTVVCAEILGHEVDLHKYAVQITVADVRDGACSSSTLKEACSWGKVWTSPGSEMVFAEATTVVPLIASDAWHRGSLEDPHKAPLGEALREVAPSASNEKALQPAA